MHTSMHACFNDCHSKHVYNVYGRGVSSFVLDVEQIVFFIHIVFSIVKFISHSKSMVTETWNRKKNNQQK